MNHIGLVSGCYVEVRIGRPRCGVRFSGGTCSGKCPSASVGPCLCTWRKGRERIRRRRPAPGIVWFRVKRITASGNLGTAGSRPISAMTGGRCNPDISRKPRATRNGHRRCVTRQGANQGEAESQARLGIPGTTNSGLELFVEICHRARSPEGTAATRSNDTRIAGVEVAGIGDCIIIGSARVMRRDE